MRSTRETGITEEMLFDALDWLRDNAEQLGKVRGHRVWMDERRKIVKAEKMNEALQSGIDAIGAQERYAYSHADYKKACQDLGEAYELEAKLFALKEAAQAKIAAFQTLSANRRIEAKTLGG